MTIKLRELKALLKEIELKEQLIDDETYIVVNANKLDNEGRNVLLGLTKYYEIINAQGDTLISFETYYQSL